MLFVLMNRRPLRSTLMPYTTHFRSARHGARRVGVPPGLDAAWRPGGVGLEEDTGLGPDRLDELDGVVTGGALAIAEKGKIGRAQVLNPVTPIKRMGSSACRKTTSLH